MDSKADRPIGITAVSTLLVTSGALVTGVAILSLCADARFLATAAGLRFEAIMLAVVFSGMSFAGFGIGLYEGYAWARLASLAFVATLQVINLAATGLGASANLYQGGFLALVATSMLYLSLPKAKRFFRPMRQAKGPSPEIPAQAVGGLQRAS
jgi:hypothetical protein